jgi:hypothetical protein
MLLELDLKDSARFGRAKCLECELLETMKMFQIRQAEE